MPFNSSKSLLIPALAAGFMLSGITGNAAYAAKPDLRVKIKAPAVARAGSDIGPRIRLVAINSGRAVAPGTLPANKNGYMIDVILSKDRNVPSGYAVYSPTWKEDVLLKGGRVSRTVDLKPRQRKAYKTGGGIPANTPTGRYFVCARIDSGNKVTERNERNNVSCSRIRIIGKRRPPVHVKEDCVKFNWKTTRVKKVGASFKIVDGSHWLHDFGNKRAEAMRSLRVIKRYRPTKHCFVGRPKPSFHYILRGNRSPVGKLGREDCVKFNWKTISVKMHGGQWKVVDGNHLMFAFGNKKNEAVQTLRIIKKYRFTRSCFVGRPGPSYTYMRR